jgi:5-hydroxyisourate hydrolase-like protein (transthyretin family)
VSAIVVVSAVAYAVSPPVETIAVGAVVVRATSIGREAIAGQVLESGKPARSTSVTLYRRRGRLTVRLKVRGVDARGRFSFRESPGSYVVVFRHGRRSARVAVTLGRGRTVFINVVIRKSGGFLIGPILFNY